MNEAKIKQMLKEKHNIDIPTDAKLVKSTKTARFETYVWMHTCGSYLVDGDRIVVKVERAKHGKKPAPRAPCFLVQKKSELTIYDMEGNIIGKGTPAP